MASRQIIFMVFILTVLASCNNQKAEKDNTSKIETEQVIKVDSATEATMLNPKYDENKIRGVGIFKIGESLDNTIGYLISTKTYRLDSFFTSAQKSKFDVAHLLDKKKFIVKLNHPKSTLDRFDEVENSTWCNDSKVYWVSLYEVDGITFENIIAIYYKNKLVEINVDWSTEFINAIESKYGKADEHIIDHKQKPAYISMHWYNQDIKAGTTSFDGIKFKFEIKGGNVFLFGCSDRDFESQDKVDKANKKAELKDF